MNEGRGGWRKCNNNHFTKSKCNTLARNWSDILVKFLNDFFLWHLRLHFITNHITDSSAKIITQQHSEFQGIRNFTVKSLPHKAGFVHDLLADVASYLWMQAIGPPFKRSNAQMTRYLGKSNNFFFLYFSYFFTPIAHPTITVMEIISFFLWLSACLHLFYLLSLFCQQDIYLCETNESCVIYHRKPQMKFKRRYEKLNVFRFVFLCQDKLCAFLCPCHVLHFTCERTANQCKWIK